jgi:hypothetical protein
MLTGAHAVLYSTNAEADRAFLRDVLRLPHVDVGGGWLIFGLPPAEVAVHPSDGADRHEIYFLCADIGTFVRTMQQKGIACGDVREERWGRVSELTLPGGGHVGVYEPRHARPESVGAKPPSRKRAAKPAARPRLKAKLKKAAAKRPARRKTRDR